MTAPTIIQNTANVQASNVSTLGKAFANANLAGDTIVVFTAPGQIYFNQAGLGGTQGYYNISYSIAFTGIPSGVNRVAVAQYLGATGINITGATPIAQSMSYGKIGTAYQDFIAKDYIAAIPSGSYLSTCFGYFIHISTPSGTNLTATVDGSIPTSTGGNRRFDFLNKYDGGSTPVVSFQTTGLPYQNVTTGTYGVKAASQGTAMVGYAWISGLVIGATGVTGPVQINIYPQLPVHTAGFSGIMYAGSNLRYFSTN